MFAQWSGREGRVRLILVLAIVITAVSLWILRDKVHTQAAAFVASGPGTATEEFTGAFNATRTVTTS